MTREQAIPYISACLDDSLAVRSIDDMPANARLVGWQCGFEPMIVAVWSYLGFKVDADDAVEIAIDYLLEIRWFSDPEKTDPDFII